MNKNFKMGVGLGGPSIIMIFVVLCLATLGTLSLVTANSDWKLTKKTADSITSYYAADSEIEEILAAAEASLRAGQPLEATTYRIKVSDNQDLVLTLQNNGSSYKIISQKLVTKSQWDYDQFTTEFNDTLVE